MSRHVGKCGSPALQTRAATSADIVFQKRPSTTAKDFLTSNVHDRAAFRIFLSLPQNFVRHRCCVTFTERNVFK